MDETDSTTTGTLFSSERSSTMISLSLTSCFSWSDDSLAFSASFLCSSTTEGNGSGAEGSGTCAGSEKKKKSHDVRKFIVKQKINQRNNNSQCKIERILNLTLIWD